MFLCEKFAENFWHHLKLISFTIQGPACYFGNSNYGAKNLFNMIFQMLSEHANFLEIHVSTN